MKKQKKSVNKKNFLVWLICLEVVVIILLFGLKLDQLNSAPKVIPADLPPTAVTSSPNKNIVSPFHSKVIISQPTIMPGQSITINVTISSEIKLAAMSVIGITNPRKKEVFAPAKSK